MENEEWNAFQEKAKGWQGAKGTMAAVKAILAAGSVESEREGCMKAVRDMLRGKDGNPFGVRGKKPILTSTQTTNLNVVLNPFGEALTAAFDANPAIAALVLPYGRSKAEGFNGASFAAWLTNRATTEAIVLAKAGTLDELLA